MSIRRTATCARVHELRPAGDGDDNQEDALVPDLGRRHRRLLLTKHATLQAPFCDAHKGHWFKRGLLTWGSFFLFGLLALGGLVLGANLEGRAQDVFMPIVAVGCVVLLVTWIVIAAACSGRRFGPPRSPTRRSRLRACRRNSWKPWRKQRRSGANAGPPVGVRANAPVAGAMMWTTMRTMNRRRAGVRATIVSRDSVAYWIFFTRKGSFWTAWGTNEDCRCLKFDCTSSKRTDTCPRFACVAASCDDDHDQENGVVSALGRRLDPGRPVALCHRRHDADAPGDLASALLRATQAALVHTRPDDVGLIRPLSACSASAASCSWRICRSRTTKISCPSFALAALFCFVVWLIIVVWAQNTGIRAKEITDEEILLTGVSSEFVSAVDASEEERRERRAERRRERERAGSWRDEDDGNDDAPPRKTFGGRWDQGINLEPALVRRRQGRAAWLAFDANVWPWSGTRKCQRVHYILVRESAATGQIFRKPLRHKRLREITQSEAQLSPLVPQWLTENLTCCSRFAHADLGILYLPKQRPLRLARAAKGVR